MKPGIFSNLAVFIRPTVEKFHPIILRTCKNVEDYIACLDTDIHFTKVHAAADKAIQTYPIGRLFTRYQNIIIPEEGRTMWDLKEASQATAFYATESSKVVTGTYDMMRQEYPNLEFPSNQKRPDVCQDYSRASFSYKGSIGYDYKNIMGKTPMDGRNQVLIGSYDRYTDIMDLYEANQLYNANYTTLKIVIDNLRDLAKKNDWTNQIMEVTRNAHLFPNKHFPPIYTKRKIHEETFTSETQQKIILAKKIQRFYSKKAYELNIPEDNFSETHVQQLLSYTPDEDF